MRSAAPFPPNSMPRCIASRYSLRRTSRRHRLGGPTRFRAIRAVTTSALALANPEELTRHRQ